MRSQSDRGSQRDDLFGLFRRPPRVTCLSSFISLRYPSMLHVTASDIDHRLLSPHPHRPVRADSCARGTASAAQGTHRRRDYDVALPARGPNVRRWRRNSTVRCAVSPTRSLSSALLFFPAARHSAPPIALRRQCSQAATVITDENGGGKGRARAAAAAPAARTARGCGICWSTSGRTWRCVAERGGTEGHILLRSLAAAAAAVQTAPSGDHRERYECPERL